MDPEEATTEAAETAPGRSRLAALVPLGLAVVVVAVASVTAAGHFLKFPLQRTCELTGLFQKILFDSHGSSCPEGAVQPNHLEVTVIGR